MRWTFWRSSAVVSVLMIASALQAAPVTTVRDRGDPANRIDLVILGDGYTAAQQEQYAQDVEALVQGFFLEQPFKEYRRYFNVHRVDVVSMQSGAYHPELGDSTRKDTAFEATYGCGGLDRLICVNTTKVENVLNASIPLEAQRDFTIVLVNDPAYGGSGGRIAVTSLDSQVIELILHEFGHSFGLLADEYEQQPPKCIDAVEPPEPNVSKAIGRNAIKWNEGGGPPSGWIDLATVLPSLAADSPDTIGAYAGGRYCTTLFRPTLNSKMRELGQPYRSVNEEQLIKRIYNYTSPIDGTLPSSEHLTIAFGSTQKFEVQTPRPTDHSLSTRWFVDQQLQPETTTALTLFSSSLTPGTHSVQVAVTDNIDKVRFDPQNALSDTHTWTVRVTPEPSTAFASLQGQVQLLRKVRPFGSFTARGRLVLGTGSNGIFPQREPLSFSISAGDETLFSQTLVANKLRLVAPRTFEFRAKAPRAGISYAQIVRTMKPLTYRYRVEGRRLNLRDMATDAVSIKLEIGNDADEFIANCKSTNSRLLRCP